MGLGIERPIIRNVAHLRESLLLGLLHPTQDMKVTVPSLADFPWLWIQDLGMICWGLNMQDGPPVFDSVQLRYKWRKNYGLFMVDITN